MTEFEREPTFSKPSFWVSMLVSGDIYIYIGFLNKMVTCYGDLEGPSFRFWEKNHEKHMYKVGPTTYKWSY